MIDKQIIFKDKTGYICGYKLKDDYWFISKFVIHSKFRGKGYARDLAKHIPQKAKLWAYPLFNFKEDSCLNRNQLIKFYLSLGFEESEDEYENHIMIRH